jgi:CheY-specific phosphatase CheX
MSATATPAAPPFPSAVCTAVRESAVAFFETACGLTAVEATDPPPAAPAAAVTGMISFVGDHSWSLALVLPEPAAEAVAKAFAGFDIPFDGPDMGDLVGEMANVMAGDIVARLAAVGVAANMSLPMVVRGHDVELLTRSDATTTRMGFRTPGGDLWFRLVKAREFGLAGRRPGT